LDTLAKLNQAERLLSETKDLADLKQIHDIAVAAEAYAAAHGLGIHLENHAMEIRLLAARRIGELVPPEQGKRTDMQLVQTSDKLEIPKQRLSDFRKLAEIPMPEFKGKIEEAKAKQEKISYYKILRGPDALVTKFTGDMENYTPPEIIEKVKAVFGGDIGLDPASCEFAQRTVQAKTYFTEADDGLNRKWHGNVFLNPPYQMPLIEQFVEKLIGELPNITSAILLTNNNTDTYWFYKSALAARAVCFTRGRISFYKTEGPRTAPTNGQAFFYFGADTARFRNVFADVGLIFKIDDE